MASSPCLVPPLIIARTNRPCRRFRSGRGGCLFVEQAVDALRPREASDRKFAKSAPAAAADAGKALGGNDGAAQQAGELLQAGGEIDRRSNTGEVEPRAAADIAVEDRADMQRDAEAEALDGVADLVLH